MADDLLSEFLQRTRLERYADFFRSEQLISAADIFYLSEDELDVIGVTDEADRDTLLGAAADFARSHVTNDTFCSWISEFGLNAAEDFLRSHHVDSVARAADLDFDELRSDLEVFPLAIRLRLARAVREARRRLMISDEAVNPVACGFWGRIPAVADAAAEFLCLRATLANPDDKDNFCVEDFLVDSGSEVVTVTPAVLERLNLPLVGLAASSGVHATVSNVALHRAVLTIGSCALHVEVICLHYNSLSVQVIRHFRHVISRDRHVWLHGDHPCEKCAESKASGVRDSESDDECTTESSPSRNKLKNCLPNSGNAKEHASD